jgi:putative transposase
MSEFNTLDPIGSLYENSFRKKQPLGGGATKSQKKEKLVEFIAYCLNPNHYHFILQQVADKGIEKFIHKLSTGYTRYFNLKQKRSGVLFQGPFKSVHISSNEQLLHTSVYVNLNFKVHGIESKNSNYLSSWDEYNGKTKINFCNKELVIGQFKNMTEYKIFANKALVEIKRRKEYLRDLEE